jgi:antitoxin ParD1/3/4
MAKNTSISLGSHFEEFINNVIKTGRFNSASEVIRAALRLLEEHERKEELLKNAFEEGEKSGYVKNFNPEILLKNLHNKHLKK